MKKLILLLTFIGILISCEEENQSEIVDIRVNHYKNTAVGLSPQFTLLIQEGAILNTDTWHNFYSSIEGFTYEPGFIYALSVKKETIRNPPQDASSFKYSLQKILSKEKVSEDVSFELTLKLEGDNFVNTSSSNFLILDAITINCENLCQELENKLQTENNVSGTFKHIDENNLQLISLN
ncbi:DUF4377 domain-containing protein [uncultured Tenacibaculum sp.]|uniref:DUF4377 domain-containing protein n=1 Tax=uncultured Tenacibaculum sp. TaxID=174713 RepID=UPI002612F5DF|nr:DUF4377 domain-containing protein [uncultured Tenacibaculum sp.]